MKSRSTHVCVEIVQSLQREEKGKAKKREWISRNVLFKVVTTKLNSSKKTLITIMDKP
jgi:hypothetical protein